MHEFVQSNECEDMTRSKRLKPSDSLKPYVAPEQCEALADPRAFWGQAARLAAELANEALDRSDDELVWIAALVLAQESVLGLGGERLGRDWEQAQRARIALAAAGVTFHLDVGEREDGSA